MANDQILLSGNPELEVSYVVQFVPSNFANPPLSVPIHLSPLSSMVTELTMFSGNPEFATL